MEVIINQTKLVMIIYFNDTNNVTKKFNLNSFFNDTNNNLYYRKNCLKV